MTMELTKSYAQTGISDQGGSWGSFNSSGSNNNGSGSWGNFNNGDINDNGNGNGSWGAFDNADPDEYVPLGNGFALLIAAGVGYGVKKMLKQVQHDE